MSRTRSTPRPAGRLAGRLDEVDLAIVEGPLGAERLAGRALLGAARRREHPGAQRRAPTGWPSCRCHSCRRARAPLPRRASRPRSTMLVQTVNAVSGTAAACVRRGLGGSAGTVRPGRRSTRRSRRLIPARTRRRRSAMPTRRDRRPTTVPAISRPGMSDAPGGGGYLPWRCIRSGRFTPAAATLISTSSAPAAGLGRSTGVRTSGPPAPVSQWQSLAPLLPDTADRRLRSTPAASTTRSR